MIEVKIKQKLPADAVLRIVDARLEAVSMAYQCAKGCGRMAEAEVMAEAKWQIVELKVQLSDLAVEEFLRSELSGKIAEAIFPEGYFVVGDGRS